MIFANKNFTDKAHSCKLRVVTNFFFILLLSQNLSYVHLLIILFFSAAVSSFLISYCHFLRSHLFRGLTLDLCWSVDTIVDSIENVSFTIWTALIFSFKGIIYIDFFSSGQ